MDNGDRDLHSMADNVISLQGPALLLPSFSPSTLLQFHAQIHWKNFFVTKQWAQITETVVGLRPDNPEMKNVWRSLPSIMLPLYQYQETLRKSPSVSETLWLHSCNYLSFPSEADGINRLWQLPIVLSKLCGRIWASLSPVIWTEHNEEQRIMPANFW